MVALEAVRASNAKLRDLSPGLVAVFGTTSFPVGPRTRVYTE